MSVTRRLLGAPVSVESTDGATSFAFPALDIPRGSLVKAYFRYEDGDVDIAVSDTAGGKWQVIRKFFQNVTVVLAWSWDHPGGTAVQITGQLGASQSWRFGAAWAESGGDLSDPAILTSLVSEGVFSTPLNHFVKSDPFADTTHVNGAFNNSSGATEVNSYLRRVHASNYSRAAVILGRRVSIRQAAFSLSAGNTANISLAFRAPAAEYAQARSFQRRIMVAVTSGGGGTNYTLTADVGSYSLTGQDASLYPTFKRTLVADAASYSLTGQDALLSYIPGGVDYYMPAEGGGYTSSGQDAGLTVVRKYALPADVGSYTLNGQDANFSVVRNYALVADVGSYTLNGQDAILAYAPGSGAYVLAADVGTYSSTGQGAATRFNARVDGSTGTYSSTGQAAALTVARRLPGAAGTYQITGNDATLTFVGVMAYTLSGETGTYTLNGSPATLTGPSDVSTRRGGWAPEMPRRKKERVDRILDDVLAVLEEQKEPERVVRRAKKTLHRVARAEQVQNLAELDTKVDLAEVEDAVTRVIHKAIKEAKVKRRRKQDEELLLML